MAINKVVYGGQTLIDLTSDTVTTASHIMEGYVGHLANGTTVTGTGSGGVDGDNLGYGVESPSATIYNGSVTFEGEDINLNLTLSDLSNTAGNTVTITWDGTEYSCACFDDDGYMAYGAPYDVFSTYPFSIYYNDEAQSWYVLAETSGTHTLVIESA